VHSTIENVSRRWKWTSPHWIAIILNAVLCVIVGRSACLSSPTFDELAHLTSGIALAKYSDTGVFRVNPPGNKWLTALAEPFMPQLKLPTMVDSSHFGNFSRNEFSLGDSVYLMNPDHLHHALVTARLFRLPMLLFGSYLLWLACSRFSLLVQVLAQALWCTSPLILGHGWIVSADAPAGVAMCAIVWSSFRWLEFRHWSNCIVSGAIWGLAIGTKFTFAPLYVGFVAVMELMVVFGRVREKKPTIARWAHWGSKNPTLARWAHWGLHAVVACLALHVLYLFQKPLVPIGRHDFISRELQSFRSPQAVGWKKIVAATPSPFPRLFLEGIDQQLADMNSPRGAYLLGARITGELPWFFLVAFWIKEQPIVIFGLCVGLATCLIPGLRRRSTTKASRFDHRYVAFCLLTVGTVIALFATQVNLVWNMRYLILVLPPLYIVTALALSRVNDLFPSRMGQRIVATAIGLVVVLDMSPKWHSPLSYASPLFGGSYRLPMALNDSNFDYGQDVYHVHRWIESQRTAKRIAGDQPVAAILSGHGLNWYAEERRVATMEDVERAVANASAATSQNDSRALWTPLIVSRGLAHAEPWAVRYSDWPRSGYTGPMLERFQDLCLKDPVAWITPTIAVYDCSPLTMQDSP
jgi:hypothetical protein